LPGSLRCWNDEHVKLGILCGGGPAPGMNSVISAATIEARKSGWDVVGIMDGFEHLIEGQLEQVRPLSITDVSRIHALGGSILRTSRANPTVRDEDAADPDWRLHACLESLRKLGIGALVTIGGDDTAFSASRLAGAAGGALRVAHVPKTIDNDLPLPGGIPTFGFETARSVGVQLVNNLMTDAITTQRWYLVVAMGRSAGHLAVGIGKSAGATLTIIAEEFPRDEPIRLSRLVDVLETAMLKRIAHGRPFGVAVLAEGIGLRLPQEELQKAMPEVELDEHGHVRLAELELDRLLAKLIKERFKERGQKITVAGKNIGYELRCAPPIPFDIEYTRDLGYSAVDYLKRVLADDEPGCMITIQDGHMVPLPFGSFSDPESGRVRIRLVNAGSSSYRVAREYMIRLDREDLEDPEKLRPIAAASGLTPEAFRDRYGYLAASPLCGCLPPAHRSMGRRSSARTEIRRQPSLRTQVDRDLLAQFRPGELDVSRDLLRRQMAHGHLLQQLIGPRNHPRNRSLHRHIPDSRQDPFDHQGETPGCLDQARPQPRYRH
jgi:6-phosphofructokinase